MEWIKVSEKLPVNFQEVLAIKKDRGSNWGINTYMCIYVETKTVHQEPLGMFIRYGYTVSSGHCLLDYQPTHWIALPKLPEGI